MNDTAVLIARCTVLLRFRAIIFPLLFDTKNDGGHNSCRRTPSASGQAQGKIVGVETLSVDQMVAAGWNFRRLEPD